jgi:hypothetical protein
MPFHVPAELLGPEKEQPRAPCVVTTAYLCRIYQIVEGLMASDETQARGSYLFADIGDRIRDLIEQAGCAGGSEDLQRLRGFFCVGVILSDCVHPAMRRRGIYNLWDTGFMVRPSHGWDDLSKVILRMKRLHDDLVVMKVERTLRGAPATKHLDPQTKCVIDTAAQAAIVLRRSLRMHSKLNSVRMGRLLANAQHHAGISADKMLDVVPHLLRVTEEKSWTVRNCLELPLLSSPRS